MQRQNKLRVPYWPSFLRPHEDLGDQWDEISKRLDRWDAKEVYLPKVEK